MVELRLVNEGSTENFRIKAILIERFIELILRLSWSSKLDKYILGFLSQLSRTSKRTKYETYPK